MSVPLTSTEYSKELNNALSRTRAITLPLAQMEVSTKCIIKFSFGLATERESTLQYLHTRKSDFGGYGYLFTNFSKFSDVDSIIIKTKSAN